MSTKPPSEAAEGAEEGDFQAKRPSPAAVAVRLHVAIDQLID
jgi:hypothetical protein